MDSMLDSEPWENVTLPVAPRPQGGLTVGGPPGQPDGDSNSSRIGGAGVFGPTFGRLHLTGVCKTDPEPVPLQLLGNCSGGESVMSVTVTGKVTAGVVPGTTVEMVTTVWLALVLNVWKAALI